LLHGLSSRGLSLGVDVFADFFGIRETSEHNESSAAHSSAKTVVVDYNGFTTDLAAIREALSVGEWRVEASGHTGVLGDDFVKVEDVHIVVDAGVAALHWVEDDTRVVSFDSVLVDLEVGRIPDLVNVAKNARARSQQTDAVEHSLPLLTDLGSVDDSDVVRISGVQHLSLSMVGPVSLFWHFRCWIR